MKKKRFLLLAVICAFLVVPGMALADSLTPDSVTASLDVGESVSISKTFTVTEQLSADVLFLFDTTGSMGGAISAAKTAASTIMSDLDVALADVSFGVAQYKDFPIGTWGESTDFAYQSVTSPTLGDATAAQIAISSLSAGGGYDGPEADLYALQQAAETSNWSDSAAHFIVWLGDAPGHDPDPLSGSAYTAGYPGPTLAETIASLQDEGVVVLALNYSGLDSYGQATAITDATGGELVLSSGYTDLVTTIVGGISEYAGAYSEVSLGVVGDHDGVDVSIEPASYVPGEGEAWDRTVERTFTFDVTFTGTAPGTYDFAIAGLVDGVATAREIDHITVGASVPEPATLLLLGTGLIGLAGFRRKLFKKS